MTKRERQQQAEEAGEFTRLPSSSGRFTRDDAFPARMQQRCRWFARCDRPATGTTPHPVFGDVPTCDRCAAFARGR